MQLGSEHARILGKYLVYEQRECVVGVLSYKVGILGYLLAVAEPCDNTFDRRLRDKAGADQEQRLAFKQILTLQMGEKAHSGHLRHHHHLQMAIAYFNTLAVCYFARVLAVIARFNVLNS